MGVGVGDGVGYGFGVGGFNGGVGVGVGVGIIIAILCGGSPNGDVITAVSNNFSFHCTLHQPR